jgi:hypothetical protein
MSKEVTGAPAPEMTLEQELAALDQETGRVQPAEVKEELKPATPVAGADQGTKTQTGDGAPKPAASPEAGAPPNPDEKPDELEAALGEIDKDKSEEKTDPLSVLSAEQRDILDLVPSKAILDKVSSYAEGYKTFTETLGKGNYDEALDMLQRHNPRALEGLMEHLYNKHVTSEEWINRWLAEKENGPVNKTVRSLEGRIQQLESMLQQQATSNKQNSEQVRMGMAAQQYGAHLKTLFDRIKLPEVDRRYVIADINAQVQGNQAIRGQILSGNPKAVNAIFTQTVRDYIKRDQQQTTETAAALGQQAKKPLPMQGGIVPESDQLPDDINQVPAEKRENWVDQQLNKLFARKGKK